jgi:hypothetical protein
VWTFESNETAKFLARRRRTDGIKRRRVPQCHTRTPLI